MAVDTLKKGSIEMLMLHMLREGDAHGYQLVQMLEERSKGKLTVQEGSLYPLLYRMADEGYITGYNVQVETPKGKKRSRVMYRLQPAGLERLEQLKKEYQEVREGIQNVLTGGTVCE